MTAGSPIPVIGARVITSDGEDLGKVKEVSGGCFKVDASMQPDYWLNSDCIAGSASGDLRLSLTKGGLGTVREGALGHAGAHSHR